MSNYTVLFAGESWFFTTIETKGYDQFSIGGYQTEIGRVRGIMRDYADIKHIPAHLVLEEFPALPSELCSYDAVIVSDVGANTFLLHPDTFFHSKRTPNRFDAIEQYVNNGGTFIMMGGYMTFQGIDGKAKYHGSVIEKILPVDLLPYDDREEHPEGIEIALDLSPHPLVADFPKKWPPILGYNKLIAKSDAEVVVQYHNDPILSLRRVGKGSTVAWASDCAPHWLPVEFCEWEYNKLLWKRVLDWAVQK
jgi:uncharacterized membrane protein